MNKPVPITQALPIPIIEVNGDGVVVSYQWPRHIVEFVFPANVRTEEVTYTVVAPPETRVDLRPFLKDAINRLAQGEINVVV